MWLSLFLEGIAVFEELGKSWGLCPQTPGRWQPLRGADAALSLFYDSFKGSEAPRVPLLGKQVLNALQKCSNPPTTNNSKS